MSKNILEVKVIPAWPGTRASCARPSSGQPALGNVACAPGQCCAHAGGIAAHFAVTAVRGDRTARRPHRDQVVVDAILLQGHAAAASASAHRHAVELDRHGGSGLGGGSGYVMRSLCRSLIYRFALSAAHFILVNNVASVRFCGGVAIAGNPCLISAVQRDSAARKTVGRTPAWLRCNSACCVASATGVDAFHSFASTSLATPAGLWNKPFSQEQRTSAAHKVQHLTVQGLTCNWECCCWPYKMTCAVCRCCQGTHAFAIHLRARQHSKDLCTQ